MRAKHYENPTIFSRVTAKNVGDVFLRHTVDPFAAEIQSEITLQVNKRFA